MWNLFCSLKPSTKKVVSLAAELKALEKDKEHLRTNLYRAEEEVRKPVEPASSKFYCVLVLEPLF